jgi:hypothetical protein
MWSWDLALKIKFSSGYLWRNKILTWDNLLCKGWEGPNICLLCAKGPESVNHLLINLFFYSTNLARDFKRD